jgi:hypothetical protein
MTADNRPQRINKIVPNEDESGRAFSSENIPAII